MRVDVVNLLPDALILAVTVCFGCASDLRRRRAAHQDESRLHIVELLLDDVEGGAHNWIWETDSHGALVHVSAGLADALGTDAGRIEGRPLVEVLCGTSPAELRAHVAASRPFRDQRVRVRVHGEERDLSLTGTPRKRGPADQRGRQGGRGRQGWHGVGSDITVALRERDEIIRLANYDELTGLANRHRFQADLAARVADRPIDGSVQLALLDLDDFKSVNDTLGHPVGDRLLAAVAERLAATAPPSVTCARIGGDEFALVASVAGPHETIEWQSFIEALDEPFSFDDTRLVAHGCIGHATLPADASTAEELVVAADLALYRAKQAGVAKLSAFDQDLVAIARRKSDIRHELARAIECDELELHFQPQVAASDGRVLAFESLLRWCHPTRGLLSPSEFVTASEETGLIVPIGERVLALACRAAKEWPPEVKVAINVSALQLQSAGFAASLAAIVAAAGLDLGRLDLEVTESILAVEASVDVLTGLRALGASVSVDGFGIGCSSLEALRRLPVDQLKIDRAFVTSLDRPDARRATAMVTAIVEIAGAFGLTTVAEGVETEAQRCAVVALGCDAIQGFQESRPMPADAVDRYLRCRRLIT
ncbi:MAG: diguanylate cyclase [Acidimicrobiales bacterium]|nr:diguanylate cyclase [Acidimicrobiales bacterium]